MKTQPESKPITVVKAIQRLKQTRGITAKDILRYITTAYDISENQVKRQMYAALKKGVDSGLLLKNRGYYRLAMESLNKNYIHEANLLKKNKSHTKKKMKRLKKTSTSKQKRKTKK